MIGFPLVLVVFPTKGRPWPRSAGAVSGAEASRGPAARHAGDAQAQRALGRLAGAAAGENDDRGILFWTWGWVKTYHYYVWGNNYPFTSYICIPSGYQGFNP